MSNTGVKSIGIKCPIFKEGDDIVSAISDIVLEATSKDWEGNEPGYHLNQKNDVIGITESVVARSAGLYVTVDEIAIDVIRKFGHGPEIVIDSPIYSRNRFSMILKGIARAAKKIHFVMPTFDEVGNPSGTNPFTGVDIRNYYKNICSDEHCEAVFYESPHEVSGNTENELGWIYCGLHDHKGRGPHGDRKYVTLADMCSDRNPDFGLLGTNKATEEKIKLFPTVEIANKVCYGVQETIKRKTGKTVEVMVYGDGCFHSPAVDGLQGSSIWEFADPVTTPGHTAGILDGKPNEIKIKAFADDKYNGLNGDELEKAVKAEISEKDGNLVGKMDSQGTTPRRYVDLLASLMDLTSGSGDKGTPVVLVQNYFENYAS